eukprot:403353099
MKVNNKIQGIKMKDYRFNNNTQLDELYNQGIFDHSWKIYYSGLRHFIPKYYGNSNIDKQTERFQVRLQNLLNIVKDPQFTYEKYAIIWNDQVKSKEFIEARQKQYGWVRNVSYLDLKIGMDCVLKSLDSPEYQEFKDIDLNTTTHLYGFRVTGYCIFQDNSVTDYLCEDFSKTRTYDQVKHIFTQCLTSPSGILVSQKLIKQLIDKIQCLKQFLENQSKAVIKGSSLFFTFARDYFDNFQDYESQLQIVDVHLIDMCHMDIIADEKERDWGFIKGLEETILLLENLQQQSNPNKIKV